MDETWNSKKSLDWWDYNWTFHHIASITGIPVHTTSQTKGLNNTFLKAICETKILPFRYSICLSDILLIWYSTCQIFYQIFYLIFYSSDILSAGGGREAIVHSASLRSNLKSQFKSLRSNPKSHLKSQFMQGLCFPVDIKSVSQLTC